MLKICTEKVKLKNICTTIQIYNHTNMKNKQLYTNYLLLF